MKKVQIADALSRTWEGTKNNWGMFLGLGLLYMLVSTVSDTALKLASKNGGLQGQAAWFLSLLVAMLFSLLLLRFSLRVAEEKGAKVEFFGEMELKGEEALRYLLSYLLLFLILFAAVLACLAPLLLLGVLGAGMAVFQPQSGAWKAFIVPGLACLGLGLAAAFYLAVSLSFMLNACVRQGLGPVESLRESWRLTEGVKGALLLLMLLGAVVMLAGVAIVTAGALAFGLASFQNRGESLEPFVNIGMAPGMLLLVLVDSFVYLDLLEQSGPRPPRA